MHDVELHTTCYLRNLLNTKAHHDPEVTTFLTMWGFEEYWHGEAIGRVLEAHGEPGGDARVAAMRQRLGWKLTASPLVWMAFSAATKHFLAVHMTFGAINEWTTQGGYARLIAEAEHPTLTDLLRRIMKQEGRHIDYYRSQAHDRLETSDGARRTTRRMVRRLWEPVGAQVMPLEETQHLVRTLFGGPDGRAVADRIDRRIDALPGLEGLGLMAGALLTYGRPSETMAAA
jgi:rubrerythrin